MEETTRLRKRGEIPVEDTWRIEDLYESDEVWEQELSTVESDKVLLTSFAGRSAESAEILYQYLQQMEAVNVKVSR